MLFQFVVAVVAVALDGVAVVAAAVLVSVFDDGRNCLIKPR